MFLLAVKWEWERWRDGSRWGWLWGEVEASFAAPPHSQSGTCVCARVRVSPDRMPHMPHMLASLFVVQIYILHCTAATTVTSSYRTFPRSAPTHIVLHNPQIAFRFIFSLITYKDWKQYCDCVIKVLFWVFRANSDCGLSLNPKKMVLTKSTFYLCMTVWMDGWADYVLFLYWNLTVQLLHFLYCTGHTTRKSGQLIPMLC